MQSLTRGKWWPQKVGRVASNLQAPRPADFEFAAQVIAAPGGCTVDVLDPQLVETLASQRLPARAVLAFGKHGPRRALLYSGDWEGPVAATGRLPMCWKAAPWWPSWIYLWCGVSRCGPRTRCTLSETSKYYFLIPLGPGAICVNFHLDCANGPTLKNVWGLHIYRYIYVYIYLDISLV